MFYRRYAKRMFDVTIALMVLVFAFPILLLTAALVRLRLGSPILFTQQRPGLHGHHFTLYKFRTMTDQRDANGDLLPDTVRLTSFGKFLRSTSLDELPELINVLKGEMSLVGPRPLLIRYYPYFTERERLRFTVRPGITGLAQISGRNDLSWDLRIATDVRYVEQYSFLLDLKILFSTFRQIFTRHGIQVDPGAVMLNFDEERQLRFAQQDNNRKETK